MDFHEVHEGGLSYVLVRLKVLQYFYEGLICALLLWEAGLVSSRVLAHVEALRMVVNHLKSSLNPVQLETFIGIALDLVARLTGLATERVDKNQSLLHSFHVGAAHLV